MKKLHGRLLLATLLCACGGALDDEADWTEQGWTEEGWTEEGGGVSQAGADGEEPSVSSLQQPIVDGFVPSVDEAQRAATVALGFATATGFDYFCSGVLISSRHLLTAMHCIAGGTPQLVLFGDDARNPAATRPGVRSASPCGTHLCNGVYSDIGIVEFDAGLPPGAVAAKLPEPNRTLQVGTLLALWGYGGDGHGNDGRKLFGFNTVSGFEEPGQVDVFDVPESILSVTACQGDSGGPGFFTSTGSTAIVAVTHGGADCAGFSNHVQVRNHLSWIRTQMALNPRSEVFRPRPVFTL